MSSTLKLELGNKKSLSEKMLNEKKHRTGKAFFSVRTCKHKPCDFHFGELTSEIIYKAEYMHSNVNTHRSKELRLTRLLKQDLLTENFKSLEWSEL